MAICSVCGKLNPPGSRNCDLCGAPLAWEDGDSNGNGVNILAPNIAQSGQTPQEALSGPICPVCRRSNRSISVFCAFCGYRLKGNEAVNNPQPYVLPNTNNAPIKSVHQIAPPVMPSDEAGNIPSGTLLKKRYRIMRKIAQGGMGAVYESTDITAPSGTRWAVKEMSPAALPASERTQAITDFRREAQMLASLEHPNLPKVVETFEELGKYFLVMEFVAGRTLQNVLDSASGPLPEERVRVWARQLMDVLNYLHSQNPPIVYRDIKPANVMLLEGTERIKLIDFGIARFHKAGKTHDTEAFGTAGYAPPEQYGKGQTDQRSDVYALAATLHYLLTRHDPGLNPFNWLPVRQYNPALSGQLEAALQTALNLDPQRRFASIADFASALGLDLPRNLAPPMPAVPPTPAPTAAPSHDQRQRNPSRQTVAPVQPKQRSQQAPPRQAPVFQQPQVSAPILFAPVPAPAPAPVATPRQVAVQDPPAPPVVKPAQPTVGADHGTTSTAPSTRNGLPPALVVSQHLVDLGETRWNKQPVGKVDLLNVGDGDLEGKVIPKERWLAPIIHKSLGKVQTVEVRVRKAALPFGRTELRVPNLFAIIWARARWALPFVGFCLWVLLLVASSVGQLLVLSAAAILAALSATEVAMWLWAFQVRLLVPAERLNTGHLFIQSSGGDQEIQVRVKARPSWLRVAVGWTSAALLMSAELGAAIWGILALVGV